MNGGAGAMAVAEREILAAAGLNATVIGQALGLLAADTDLADLYFQSRRERSWRLEDGKVSAGGFAMSSGVGARAAREGRVAFAHSADLRPHALIETAQAVRSMRRHGDAARTPAGIALDAPRPEHRLYGLDPAIGGENAAAWIAVLRRVDTLARESHCGVIRVEAGLRAVDDVILIAEADRGLAADVRPLLRLSIRVVVERLGRRAVGAAGIGGRHGLSGLTDAVIAAAVARAVGIATTGLDALPAPVGTMPVVLAPGYPGVLFHEAVGHGLEGDFHRKRLSAFAGRIGERIAPPGVTVIDDGSLPGRLGSVGIDDEGTPGERTVLVEDGMLAGVMQDRLNAGLMNARSTGNARRQSYAQLPLPRMTNTFLAAGTDDPADILASVDRGIYAVEMGGGQVDIVTGRFNFTTTEAWLIEKGRLVHPVEGATLIGVGHEALRGITMVGNDLALDPGVALCGKHGQQLDVSVGQPTLRIDGMMVGGRAA
ncbi:MAG: metallopeptidase TldD-related protein [Sphingomonas phyllosphaerae]|uniref:metallopeptidase TldD-related protein n=1 Tax=Sphingomonas phyllosphaerae TaxID=257003 RepID=UPI002FF63668